MIAKLATFQTVARIDGKFIVNSSQIQVSGRPHSCRWEIRESPNKFQALVENSFRENFVRIDGRFVVDSTKFPISFVSVKNSR